MSALAQPSSAFSDSYLHHDIYSLAAAYLFHLVMNHPFIDGNKRVATVSALVFLELNGYELEVDEDLLFETVIKVASSELFKKDLIAFFKKYTFKQS